MFVAFNRALNSPFKTLIKHTSPRFSQCKVKTMIIVLHPLMIHELSCTDTITETRAQNNRVMEQEISISLKYRSQTYGECLSRPR